MNIPAGDYIIEFYGPDGAMNPHKTLTQAIYHYAVQAGEQNICDKYPHYRVLKVMVNSTDKPKEPW